MPAKHINLFSAPSEKKEGSVTKRLPRFSCVAFVYNFNGEESVITGPIQVVASYIQKNYYRAMVHCSVTYKKIRMRCYWQFIGVNARVRFTNKRHKRYLITNNDGSIVMTFRRMPNRWIPEFNRFEIDPAFFNKKLMAGKNQMKDMMRFAPVTNMNKPRR